MTDNARTLLAAAIEIIAVYWAFVIGVRSAFGVHLPDPADFLPQEWRSRLP